MNKFHAFYLDNVLLVRLINKQTDNTKKEGDITLLYSGDTLIGYNIFNIQLDLPKGLLDYNKEVETLVNDRLSKINQGPLEMEDVKSYFKVGYVKECEKHPDSNKLSVTQIDFGTGDLSQVVCGASNIAQGQKVVVAQPGAVLNDGTWIGKGKLLKVDSNGMVCSAKELGLAKESQGILVLEDNVQVGSRFFNEN